jgi:hypothetical protein
MKGAAVIKKLQFEIRELEPNNHSLTELNGHRGPGLHTRDTGNTALSGQWSSFARFKN